jgi:hypothetical protein
MMFYTVADSDVQEGDKFWRLPEVYVKGNNVGIPRSSYGMVRC